VAVDRDQLKRALDEALNSAAFNDYCPNGLQVEGSAVISRLVSGVTASQALIDRAIALEADAILVHHGYFWRGEDPCLVGMKGRRISTLIRANINLFAYHLPLDNHPTLGNNAGLGRALELSSWESLNGSDASYPVFTGSYEGARPLSEVSQNLSEVLGRSVTTVGEADTAIRSVAWCTGGGQGYIDDAADAGVDLFITGEISEQTVHVARERNIAFIAAGHHATERFGARALGDWLAQTFDIEHEFVDIDSPA
jgi:dinuclear metal center YbgI/SA1388 family protein